MLELQNVIAELFKIARTSDELPFFQVALDDVVTYDDLADEMFEGMPVESRRIKGMTYKVPVHWSETAASIFASKYCLRAGVPWGKCALQGAALEPSYPGVPWVLTDFLKPTDSEDLLGPELDFRWTMLRLVRFWTRSAVKHGYIPAERDAVEAFAHIACYMLYNQVAFPNSPQWFNVGKKHSYGIDDQNKLFLAGKDGVKEVAAGDYPLVYACFLLGVPDSIDGMMEAFSTEARLFKSGAGVGTNFSSVRAKGSPVAGGGSASGIISFMEIGDKSAGCIKSGGINRRAAIMRCLDADHADVDAFIDWKPENDHYVSALKTGSEILIDLSEKLKEGKHSKEDLREVALQAGITPAEFDRLSRFIDQGGKPLVKQVTTHWDTGGYGLVSGQNSNNTVRVTDEFMEKALKDPSSKEGKTWQHINEVAWLCGDPGLHFTTTINNANTCAADGPIRTSNPCSEVMFLDNTACHLVAQNLNRMHTLGLPIHLVSYFWTCILDISICEAALPSPAIAQGMYNYRNIGLGFTGLGALFMRLGLPYDSVDARNLATRIQFQSNCAAIQASMDMGKALEPFPRFHANAEIARSVYQQSTLWNGSFNTPLPEVARNLKLLSGFKQPYVDENAVFRNAQLTAIAPTGCLVPESLIATDQGIRRLATLGDVDGTQWQDVNFQVQTDDGPRTATKFFVNGMSHVVRAETSRGYAVSGTPEHRLKVVRPNGDWEWVRMGDLRQGDILPMKLGQIIGNPREVKLPPLGDAHFKSTKSAVVPRTVTPELAEFVGYFMGDGSLHAKGIRLSVTEGDQDTIDHLVGSGQKLFGLEAHITKEVGCVSIAFHSVPLVMWWEACGFSKLRCGTGGKGSWSSHVPEVILASNDPKVYAAFIRGLFEADGTSSGGRVSWSTVVKQNSEDVRALLLALGFPTTTTRQVAGYSGSTVYVMSLLNRWYAEIWMQTIGFIGARKAAGVQGPKRAVSEGDIIPVTKSLFDAIVPAKFALRSAATQSIRRYGGVSRSLAATLFEQTGDTRIGHLLEFFYDKLESAELSADEVPTYDISVTDNVTYIANGFVSHNTTGLGMDAVTLGIEPEYQLVRYKSLAGGGSITIENPLVAECLTQLRGSAKEGERLAKLVSDAGGDTTQVPELTVHERNVLACAGDISPRAHVDMCAAVQPYVSGSISKTINLPNSATIADVADMHAYAHRTGCKCVAIYRDGCKQSQPMTSKAVEEDNTASVLDALLELRALKKSSGAKPQVKDQPPEITRGTRRELPFRREGFTETAMIDGHRVYLGTGEYEGGDLGEVYLTISHQGSTLSGIYQHFAKLLSVAIQYGVPLEALIKTIKGSRFEPHGFVRENPFVRTCSSILDFVAQVLERNYLGSKPVELTEVEAAPAPKQKISITDSSRPIGDMCRHCGAFAMRTNGSCKVCTVCGTTTGCG